MQNCTSVVGTGRGYLWTFTFAECLPVLELRSRWNHLLTLLRRALPNWCGVRVYEEHPGKYEGLTHGLHVHVITNRFFDVTVILGLARSSGWGRINVKRIKKGAERYVAKYLGKRRPAGYKGWRLWASFGGGFRRTRVADIVVDSFQATVARYLAARLGSSFRLTWEERQIIVSRWTFERLAGYPFSMVSVRGRLIPGRPAGLFASSSGRRSKRPVPLYSQPFLPWPFHPALPRLSSLSSQSPFASCWGPDLQKSDLTKYKVSVKYFSPE